MTEMENFIEGMPKAELHLHIEGTIGPEKKIELAQRNRIELPYKDEKEVISSYNYTDLEDFLRISYNFEDFQKILQGFQ